MQIILNPLEVQLALVKRAQKLASGVEFESTSVQLNEDGSAVISINEDATDGPEPTPGAGSQPAGEPRQKKPRRTKAQIAEDERLAAEAAEAAKAEQAQANEAGNPGNTPTSSAEAAPASDNAAASAVNSEQKTETGSDTNSRGDEPEVKDPEPKVDPTPADPEPETPEPEAPADEPEPVQEPEVASEAPAVKPAGVSLFANLRKPTNS